MAPDLMASTAMRSVLEPEAELVVVVSSVVVTSLLPVEVPVESVSEGGGGPTAHLPDKAPGTPSGYFQPLWHRSLR